MGSLTSLQLRGSLDSPCFDSCRSLPTLHVAATIHGNMRECVSGSRDLSLVYSGAVVVLPQTVLTTAYR